MPLESDTLPGYIGLPADEIEQNWVRIGTVNAKRITGPFLVRGTNFVQHIEDGWLCSAEDGTLFGVEDAVQADRFEQANVAPEGWTDTVTVLPEAQIGVAYNETITPPTNSHVPSFAQITFGEMHAGLTLNRTDPEAVSITGTPTGSADTVYFEISWTWGNFSPIQYVTQRYAMTVLAGA